MKRIYYILLCALVSLLVVGQCKAQLNTNTRQIRFGEIFKAADTAATIDNAGRFWYDHVTQKFRYNSNGENSSVGSGGGSSYTAGIGLILSGTQFRLGGSLTSLGSNVILNASGPSTSFNFQSAGNTVLSVNQGTGALLGLSTGAYLTGSKTGALSITDNRATKIGVVYSGDYSAGYTDRSLPDWGSVWKDRGTTTLNGDNTVNIGTGSGNFLIFSGNSGVYLDNSSTNGGSVQLISSPSDVTGFITLNVDADNFYGSGEGITFNVSSGTKLQVKKNGDIIVVLPTSCVGKSTGTMWNDAGTLKVCP